MKKKEIIKGLNRKNSLPSNILDFLNDRSEQRASAKKLNNWLQSICNRNISGGTAVGKHYSTLILDITYQGGEVSISEEGTINMFGTDINDKNEFVKCFNEYFEIVQK